MEYVRGLRRLVFFSSLFRLKPLSSAPLPLFPFHCTLSPTLSNSCFLHCAHRETSCHFSLWQLSASRLSAHLFVCAHFEQFASPLFYSPYISMCVCVGKRTFQLFSKLPHPPPPTFDYFAKPSRKSLSPYISASDAFTTFLLLNEYFSILFWPRKWIIKGI